MEMTPALPDFSEWLRGDRLAAEEKIWLEGEHYEWNLVHVRKALAALGSRPKVLELGCGTGNMARSLVDEVEYLGVDKNPEALEMARAKSSAMFLEDDLRHFSATADLCYSFAVLKHFGLHEWDSLFAHVLSLAPNHVHQLQVTNGESFDDGVNWHSVWLNKTHLLDLISKYNFILNDCALAWSGAKGEEWVIQLQQAVQA